MFKLKKSKIETFLVSMLLISVILGYIASYQKLYLFHVICIFYYLAILLGIIKLSRTALKSIIVILTAAIYSVISLLWSVNLINGAFYLFYFFCGITIVLAITNFSKTEEDIFLIFKILSIMLIINFLIGLLETTGHFRLPMSPYASSNGNLTKTDFPSGFSSNLNDFGFIFIAIFPFLFLHPNKIISITGIIIGFWFMYKLQSKGFLLGLLVFFLLYFLLNFKKKLLITPLIISLIISIPLISAFDFELSNRSFSLFEEVNRGFEIIFSETSAPSDSTSTRAYFYRTGIQELIHTIGLGAGVAGISSILQQANNQPISFHFFFLEMLIDFGVIPFLILIFYYYKIIKKLFKAKNSSMISNKLIYLSKSSAYSLVIIPFASISPSSIIYILPFWAAIGFAIAVVIIINKQELKTTLSKSYS